MDEGDDELAAALAASMATFEQEEQLQQAPPVRGSLHEFVHTCGASTWKSCPEEPSACSEQCPNVQPETWRHVPHACPFTASTPRSICIRRTIGRLSVSGVDGLLHVGVSDSKGIPLHFDEKGVRTDGVWGDSLVVPLSSDLSDEEWDQALSGHRATWRGRKYHATDTNCYDFVVSFFNTIRLQGRTNHDKFGVVESMIRWQHTRLRFTPLQRPLSPPPQPSSKCASVLTPPPRLRLFRVSSVQRATLSSTTRPLRTPSFAARPAPKSLVGAVSPLPPAPLAQQHNTSLSVSLLPHRSTPLPPSSPTNTLCQAYV